MKKFSPRNFLSLGIELFGGNSYSSQREAIANYKAHYQAHPKICSKIWRLLKRKPTFNCLVQPHHLLWTFYYMKHYNNERVNCKMFNCDRKTMKKYVWYVIKQIAKLKQVVVSKNICFM